MFGALIIGNNFFPYKSQEIDGNVTEMTVTEMTLQTCI